jgi:hypothetical protein
MRHYYLVVIPISPIEESEEYLTLPLHCTVLPWLRLARITEETFLHRMRQVAGFTPHIPLIGNGRGLFGPSEDIKVTTLEPTFLLKRLHGDLLSCIKHDDGIFEAPEWLANRYRPHVTDTKTASFKVGEQVMGNVLTVLRADGSKDAPRSMIAEYPLATD